MAKSGTSFEIEVQTYIQNSINAGDWGIDPALAKVLHKAQYWSQKRDAFIITDVSVELYRPKQADYWFLWVIECKDLGHNVPVDDIDEFAQKLQQIKVPWRPAMVLRKDVQPSPKTAASASSG